MKTRIVYPALWLDEKFANCKLATKLLFMYLITNEYLGLSRYSRISDRKILFNTGLNTVQLKEAKAELEEMRWCFFKNEWVYHNHECAYVDYIRNDRTAQAKEKEISLVKPEIVLYFNEFCLNNVQTVLELKSETRNKKPKTKKETEDFSDELGEYLKTFNEVYGTKYKSIVTLKNNFSFWRNQYSLEEIIRAVKRSKNVFWAKQPTPDLLLRTKNKNGECDYIGEILNKKSDSELELSQFTQKE